MKIERFKITETLLKDNDYIKYDKNGFWIKQLPKINNKAFFYNLNTGEMLTANANNPNIEVTLFNKALYI